MDPSTAITLYNSCIQGSLDAADFILTRHPTAINYRYGPDREVLLGLASASQHPHMVRYLLQRPGILIDIPNTRGATALFEAAAHGNTEIAQLLLDVGANPNHQTTHGITPMLIAAEAGHTAMVQLLLDVGVDPNYTTPLGRSALLLAVVNNHIDTAGVLLSRGAVSELHSISKTSEIYGSALTVACEKGRLQIVNSILEHKTDMTTQEMMLAMHKTVHFNHPLVTRTLLQHGVDVNIKDGVYTPLHIAVKHKFLDVVKELLPYNPCGIALDGQQLTPLDLAVAMGYMALIELLVSEGADLDGGLTRPPALHVAVAHNQLEAITYLLDHGADITTYHNGSNALHEATMHRQLNAVKLLVERGIDKDALTSHMNTALTIAVNLGHVPIIEFLLDAGSNIHGHAHGYMPLSVAATSTNPDIIELLIRRGADIHRVHNTSNRTPIFDAIISKNIYMLRVLLSNGASPNIRDKTGAAPIAVAAAVGFQGGIKLLLQYGADMNTRDAENVSLIYRSVIQGSPEGTKLLAIMGAPMQLPITTHPIFSALRGDRIEHFQAMMECGYRPDAMIQIVAGHLAGDLFEKLYPIASLLTLTLIWINKHRDLFAANAELGLPEELEEWILPTL